MTIQLLNKKKTTLFLLQIFILIRVTHAQQDTSSLIDDRWYKNAFIYNIDVHTFKDSDGDGVGDFNGLTASLPYLQELGVSIIWLAPFQPSPLLDDGYDVADYYGIDKQCGSPGDFAEFMYQAKQHGIRVIMDMVLNHTSDQHPWFKASKNVNSRYHDWYFWSPAKPKAWNQGMGFPGVQKATWTYDDTAKAWYYHRFYDFQPHLNFSNPYVRTEGDRILGYWLQQGMTGFRMDAVPFMIEIPRKDTDNAIPQYELIPRMRNFIRWRSENAIILGEANVLPDKNALFFGNSDEGIPLLFNFYENQYQFYALATGDATLLWRALLTTKKIPPTAQWAYFMRNHDEVDLGRLTDEQREKVFHKFGPRKSMQLYQRGIRRRLAPMLDNNVARLRMAYSLLFALPGTPVLHYGEELGMGDAQDLKERLAVRTPMQWNNEKHAGFSNADKIYRPVIDTGRFAFEKINVLSESTDTASLLTYVKKFIALRKACPEVGMGDWQVADSSNKAILALRYNYHGQMLITIHNFSDQQQQIRIKREEHDGNALLNLMSHENIAAKENIFSVTIEPYGYRWYRLKQ